MPMKTPASLNKFYPKPTTQLPTPKSFPQVVVQSSNPNPAPKMFSKDSIEYNLPKIHVTTNRTK